MVIRGIHIHGNQRRLYSCTFPALSVSNKDEASVVGESKGVTASSWFVECLESQIRSLHPAVQPCATHIRDRDDIHLEGKVLA